MVTALQWTGPAAVSCELAEPDDPCMTSSAGYYTLFVFRDSLTGCEKIFSILKHSFAVSYLTEEAFLDGRVPIPEHIGRLPATISVTSTLKQSSIYRGITEMTETVAAMFGKVLKFDVVEGNAVNAVTNRVEYDGVNDTREGKKVRNQP